MNGTNLIKNGDVIWGSIMVALPFFPMTVFLLFIAFGLLTRKDARCRGLLLLLLLLPAAALATPAYICFIVIDAILRLIKPQMANGDKLLGGSPMLRMLEVVGESYPQALLGE